MSFDEIFDLTAGVYLNFFNIYICICVIRFQYQFQFLAHRVTGFNTLQPSPQVVGFEIAVTTSPRRNFCMVLHFEYRGTG